MKTRRTTKQEMRQPETSLNRGRLLLVRAGCFVWVILAIAIAFLDQKISLWVIEGVLTVFMLPIIRYYFWPDSSQE